MNPPSSPASPPALRLPPGTRIARRSDAINPFEYEICLPGAARPVRAYLTRSFSAENGHARDTLLVGVRGQGPESELTNGIANFHHLVRRCQELRQTKLAVETAKTLVNEIATGASPDGWAVAVHTFGPVPVYRAALDHETEGFAGFRPRAIAFYPAGGESRRSRASLAGTTGPIQFLHCLDGRYAVCFLRYVEDIGGYFDLIRAGMPLDRTFAAARAAEDRIGASIASKLQSIDGWATVRLSRKKQKLHPERLALAQLAKEVRQRNLAELRKGAFIRAAALYFLNEFYQQVGIKKKMSYRTTVARLANDARDDADWVGEISTLVDQYKSGLPPAQWFPPVTVTYWTSAFHQFARFLATLREVPRLPGVPVFRCHTRGNADDAATLSVEYLRTELRRGMEKLPMADTNQDTEVVYRWISEVIWGHREPIPGRFAVTNECAAKIEELCREARLRHVREWLVGLLRFCRINEPSELQALNRYLELLSEQIDGRVAIWAAGREKHPYAAKKEMLTILRTKCKGRVFLGAQPFQLIASAGKFYHCPVVGAVNANLASFEQIEIQDLIAQAFDRATQDPCDWLWI